MVKAIHDEHITWPRLAEECTAWVKACPECQRNNIVKKGYHPLKPIHAQLPGDHMAIDLAGPFPRTTDGERYMLILVDVCTRFVFLRPLKTKRALDVATTLFDIFCIIGFPRILQSDNGSEFVNHVVRSLTVAMGTKHRLVTPYHPRANGVAERHVQTACSILRKEIQAHGATWAQHLNMAQLAMNTRVVALHNSSPFSLFFARKFNGFHNYTDDKDIPLSHEQLMQRLQYMTEVVFPAVEEKSKATQKRMIERFNATILHNEFPDGAKVMTLDPIKGDKLLPRYEGPYTVVRRTAGGSYELRDGTGDLLERHYAPSQLKLVLDDLDDLPIYEVERISKHRASKDKPDSWEYRTHWKGYLKPTWEPEQHFIEQQCIRDYWSRLGPGVEEKEQANRNLLALQHASSTQRTDDPEPDLHEEDPDTEARNEHPDEPDGNATSDDEDEPLIRRTRRAAAVHAEPNQPAPPPPGEDPDVEDEPLTRRKRNATDTERETPSKRAAKTTPSAAQATRRSERIQLAQDAKQQEDEH